MTCRTISAGLSRRKRRRNAHTPGAAAASPAARIHFARQEGLPQTNFEKSQSRSRTAMFKSRVEQGLRDILGARGVSFDTVFVEDAPMIGSAVAGLIA